MMEEGSRMPSAGGVIPDFRDPISYIYAPGSINNYETTSVRILFLPLIFQT